MPDPPKVPVGSDGTTLNVAILGPDEHRRGIIRGVIAGHQGLRYKEFARERELVEKKRALEEEKKRLEEARKRLAYVPPPDPVKEELGYVAHSTAESSCSFL